MYISILKLTTILIYDKNKILLKIKVVYKKPAVMYNKLGYILGNFGAVTTGLACCNSLRPSFL